MTPARRRRGHFAYERRTDALMPTAHFVRRLGAHLGLAAGGIGVSLLAGTAGYHYWGRMAWIDALLNAAMLLGGMGQVGNVDTTSGKLFASGFSLYAGFVLIGAASLVLAPVIHRVLHKMHLDESALEENAEE